MVHSAHADSSAALGAALQAAAIHRGCAVGEYCAVARCTIDADTGGTTVYIPDVDTKALYEQLYRRHISITDVIYSDSALLQIPRGGGLWQ